MGSTLGIVANHGLNISTAVQGISEIEKCLGYSIEAINDRSMLNDIKSQNSDITRYFYITDIAEENFNRYKEISLHTNNVYSPELQIKLHTINFPYSLCRYSEWKQAMLGDQYENNEAQINRCKSIWPTVRSFAIYFSKTLKGTKLIYFDSDRFQLETDIIFEGGYLEDMFNAMCKKWEPTEYNNLIDGIKDSKITNGWYYEKI